MNESTVYDCSWVDRTIGPVAFVAKEIPFHLWNSPKRKIYYKTAKARL
jgi:hypothetical protein